MITWVIMISQGPRLSISQKDKVSYRCHIHSYKPPLWRSLAISARTGHRWVHRGLHLPGETFFSIFQAIYSPMIPRYCQLNPKSCLLGLSFDEAVAPWWDVLTPPRYSPIQRLRVQYDSSGPLSMYLHLEWKYCKKFVNYIGRSYQAEPSSLASKPQISPWSWSISTESQVLPLTFGFWWSQGTMVGCDRHLLCTSQSSGWGSLWFLWTA